MTNTTLNSTGPVTMCSSIAISLQDGNHLFHLTRLLPRRHPKNVTRTPKTTKTPKTTRTPEIKDDHSELTPFPDAGDLLNAVLSFFLEPEVSPVHSLALDSVVGVHAEDSVMHVGDADGTVAVVDMDDRAADAGMMVDLGGLADVVEGFIAFSSAPSPVSLDQVTLGMEVQVPEEEAMVGLGVVVFLAAQEKAKLTAWQQAFSSVPHQSFLQSVQGEPTTGVTCMEATYPSCTMSCSKEEQEHTLTGDFPGCLFMTFPRAFPHVP
eukprot:CAMPEP_0173081904 /NCGR_PEP_ID=MMETSP1102-20130122/17689_1 /TAXON_ID=49646 /ORGANISM="Geminigera sp., Strain Caron Lab Isolate" /LENGTH=264 /DNA_ID=CAMNT_0013956851 /DNA_START=81 /DNA_END=873 /DNA_ORIENTATION=-